jgi:multidrug efflux pump subunit AcrA (membrane-fusion protein)
MVAGRKVVQGHSELHGLKQRRDDTVAKKILLLLMLVAAAAIAAEAIGQAPAAPAGTAPTLNPPSTMPAPGSSVPGASQSKSAEASPVSNKSIPVYPAMPSRVDAGKVDASKTPGSGKVDAVPAAKDAPAGKEAPASKTFDTSSAAPPGSTSGALRTTITIDRSLVTLIDDVKVPATEPGMLMEINVKEGNSVEKNALVAVIDSRSTIAKQQIAMAELNAARASAENDAELEVAEAAIQVSLAEYEQSIEIRRTNKNAVSESQLRKDKFGYEKSLAQKKQAVNEKKIAGLTANAKQAQYEAASIELDLRQIHAPFKGEVVEVMKHVGEWVTVGEPIMHVVGLEKVRVKGFVFVSGPNGASPEEVIGKDVTITVDAAGGKKRTVKGKIGFASPIIEGVGTSRQFRIWSEVDNKKMIDQVTKQEIWELQPGSVATMTIDLTSGKPALATSTDASKTNKGKVEAFRPVTTQKKVSKER